MPDADAVRRYVEELPAEEAFEPAQHALVRVALKWLHLLTPEERQEFRGILIEYEPYEPGLVPVEGYVPIRVTLLKREPVEEGSAACQD